MFVPTTKTALVEEIASQKEILEAIKSSGYADYSAPMRETVRRLYSDIEKLEACCCFNLPATGGACPTHDTLGKSVFPPF